MRDLSEPVARNEDVYRKLTDFIEPEESLLCFSFDLPILENEHGSDYVRPINRAVLQALSALAGHPSLRVSSASFCVYCGKRSSSYLVGIPRLAPSAAASALEAALRAMPGFRKPIPLTSDDLCPSFRYHQGRLIAYGEERTAGALTTVGELTGVDDYTPVLWRCSLPAMEFGRECYGGLDYAFLDLPARHPELTVSLFGEPDDPAHGASVEGEPATARAVTRPRPRKSSTQPKAAAAQLPLDFGDSE